MAARSVADINTALVQTLVDNFAAVGITITPTTWSKRNIMRLMCYSFSVAAAFIEQLMDIMKGDIEIIAAQTPAMSALHIQKKMFEFQYSASNPQFLTVTGAVPSYAIIDPTLRIIAACSVTSTIPNEVLVKMAKLNDAGDGLQALSLTPNNELAPAQSYINQIGTTGIQYFAKSTDPDLLYIQADIYYNGQYTGMKDVVVATLKDFLKTLSVTNFNGALKVSDVERLIRDIPGVNDVVIQNMKARNWDLPFASAIPLVTDGDVVARQWMPVAGYLTEEPTPNDFYPNLTLYPE
jgi:hypothetical protein